MPKDKMIHLDLPWRVETDDGDVCIVTDVPKTGPFFWIMRLYPQLAGDISGFNTAGYIVGVHNDELKRRLANNDREARPAIA